MKDAVFVPERLREEEFKEGLNIRHPLLLVEMLTLGNSLFSRHNSNVKLSSKEKSSYNLCDIINFILDECYKVRDV